MKVLFSYEGGAIFYEGGIEVEVDGEVQAKRFLTSNVVQFEDWRCTKMEFQWSYGVGCRLL